MIKTVLLILLLTLPAFQQGNNIQTTDGSITSEVEVSSSNDQSIIPQASQTSQPKASLALANDKSSPTAVDENSLKMISIPSEPTDWNFLSLNSLGGSSKWIYPNGTFKIYPRYWITTYTIKFYIDCPKNGVSLHFATTGTSFVYLNGHLLLSWYYPYPSVHQLNLQEPELVCGCNILKIIVYNFYYQSPAALIYSLSQSTTGCYNCTNLGVSFYNKTSCKCECSSKGSCSNPLMFWADYPQCGCMCKKSLICPKGKYYNYATCKCQCNPSCCNEGYIQDEETCACKKKPSCIPTQQCKMWEVWDPITCQCIKNCVPINCGIYYIYNPKTCQCQCPPSNNCVAPKIWNAQTCQCECNNVGLCRYPTVWNPQTCQCACPNSNNCISPRAVNPKTCECECNIICASYYTIDLKNCRCVYIPMPTLSLQKESISSNGSEGGAQVIVDSTVEVAGRN